MNPHEKILIDEASGIPYENQRYLDYQDGIREVVGWIDIDYLLNALAMSMHNMKHSKTISECNRHRKILAELKEWGVE